MRESQDTLSFIGAMIVCSCSRSVWVSDMSGIVDKYNFVLTLLSFPMFIKVHSKFNPVSNFFCKKRYCTRWLLRFAMFCFALLLCKLKKVHLGRESYTNNRIVWNLNFRFECLENVNVFCSPWHYWKTMMMNIYGLLFCGLLFL